MEMSTKKDYETRRHILAVAIFFSLSMATGQVAAEDTADNFLVDDSSSAVSDESTTEEISTNNLQISGTKNNFTLDEDISSTKSEAVGILVEGLRNQIMIPRGLTINLRGLNSTGILIADGYEHNLDVFGNIFAAGNAVEINGASVDNFNLRGNLTGGEYAIYIGENSFVKNININSGASIKGNILSENYNPNLTTNLNFNANFSYDGKISGANSIKLYINNGTAHFSGSANVLSVDVGIGAKLFGSMFTLNDTSTSTTTGTFINHGTIGADSPDTNLVINGNLISDGILQKVSGGKAGLIIVNGNANIEGSTVTTDSLLPNETARVLIADSITGNIKNPAGKPVQISALLTATGEIVGNTVFVTTHEADFDNDFAPELDSQEEDTLNAMNSMFETLDNTKQREMREFYNLKPAEIKDTLMEIGSNDAAQVMSVAQQNNAVDRMISSRVSKVFVPEHVNINVSPLNFADGESNAPNMKVKVKVPSRQENNFWLNYMKNWGSLRGGTDYHGSVIVGGYDRPIGKKWRAGIFATYGTIGYGAETSRATVYDTRLGLYAGYHNRASDVYFYVNGGQLRNSLHRGISALDLSTNAKYKSRIFEIGGEYKYDLTPKKIWHVSPFVNFQASHLKQNAYNEHGAGIYNQHVESNSNTYFAAQTGLDLKRYYRTGMLGFRFGVKHGFTGADPDLQIRYEGDASNSYRLRHKRDKTHLVFSVRGESEFARGWFMGGEAEIQRGDHDKDVTASIMLRRIW